MGTTPETHQATLIQRALDEAETAFKRAEAEIAKLAEMGHHIPDLLERVQTARSATQASVETAKAAPTPIAPESAEAPAET